MKIHLPTFVSQSLTDILSSIDPYKPLAIRVVAATLPFFALYQPFRTPIVLATGGIRLIAEGTALLNGKRERSQYAKVAASAAVVAGTIFNPPLGMLISTARDLNYPACPLE